jgi:hypothetical protein
MLLRRVGGLGDEADDASTGLSLMLCVMLGATTVAAVPESRPTPRVYVYIHRACPRWRFRGCRPPLRALRDTEGVRLT